MYIVVGVLCKEKEDGGASAMTMFVLGQEHSLLLPGA
jgi:hypothetical protein